MVAGVAEADARAPVGEEEGGVEGHDGDLAPEEPLDRHQVVDELLAGEGHGLAGLARAGRAPDAVHVGLGLVGEVVVHDEVEGLDVEAAGGHVGGDEDADPVLLETLDDLEALGLGQVSHDELAVHAVDLEPPRDLLDHELLVAEDEGALGILAGEDAEEEAELLVVADVVELLGHEVDRDVLGLDRDLLRPVHVLPGEILDAQAQGRGEEEGLAVAGRREIADELAQVVDEAHVEHAVGLVDDEEAHLAEEHLALLHEVDDAARRADDHLHVVAEHVDLGAVGDAAVEGARADREVLAEALGLALDLHRELAGRREDEDLAGAEGVVRHDALEDRDEEGGGLAGAGLRLGVDVLAREGVAEDHLLHRGAGHVAHLVERLAQVGVEVQFREFHRFTLGMDKVLSRIEGRKALAASSMTTA